MSDLFSLTLAFLDRFLITHFVIKPIPIIISVTIIYGDTIAHRVAHKNLAQRMEEQQWDLPHHRETRSDPEYQAR